MRSKPYSATSVKSIHVADMVLKRDGQACDVGLDVSKSEFLVVVRWSTGSFERPWRVHLDELSLFVEKLNQLAIGRDLVIAMEPSGSYCDPVRQVLHNAGFRVHRVKPKLSHDYAEVLDGVPSQHDGKDAACVAELSALKKRAEWPWDPTAQELKYEIDWMDAQQQSETKWLARLEGLLGRYWPEVTHILRMNSATLLKVLQKYGGPAALAADPNAAKQLKHWGGSKLDDEKINRLLKSAANTAGVLSDSASVKQFQRYATEALKCRSEVTRAKKELKRLTANNEVVLRQSKVVGHGTAAVLWARLGDPNDYHCANAYCKAMGLNLKERSSGYWKGHLKISKRGSSQVRRWLFFAALRYSHNPWLAGWYQKRKNRGEGHAMRAVVALMRKLSLSLYYVGRGSKFDVHRLVPGAARFVARKRKVIALG